MKMKKAKILILFLGILLLTSGCGKNYLVQIDYDEYKNLIDQKETFVLEVMQDGCPSCKGIRPKLKKVAEKYGIEIKYIDINEVSEEGQKEIGADETPTLIFYIDGEEETTSARLIGNTSEKKIISKLQASGFIKEE